LQNTYATSDGWVLIVASSDNIWPRVCQAVDVPEWIEDSLFKPVRGRDKAWQVIAERLTVWFATGTFKEAIDTFSCHGIPINAVNDIPTAAHEPQLHERELLVEVPVPIAGRIHVSGKNIKLSRSEVIVGSAPLPGQHMAEILTSLLHYTPEEVKKLESEARCMAARHSRVFPQCA
jgi:crotonobetainyl-CoA:carnitine CoA-transferase CaiB-like acyl-CoA transferase